jgi:hypothetical protein
LRFEDLNFKVFVGLFNVLVLGLVFEGLRFKILEFSFRLGLIFRDYD